jgi:hypothetical protein
MQKTTTYNQRRPQISNGLIHVLQQQIRRWPLATCGAAIVAAYLLGRRQSRPVAAGKASSLPASQDTMRGSPEHHGLVRSEAPNASFASGAGSGALGFDSPAITSNYLSNTDVGGPDQGRPYFPPGGAPDRDRSGPEQGGDS